MERDAASTSLDLVRLRQRFRAGELTAAALVEDIVGRIAAAGDDKVWISRVPEAALRARAAALDALAKCDRDYTDDLPLFGIPFAVKDNIDVAGMSTTAACPDFAYKAAVTAPAVARLEEAGAILVGKTNLDQFATGLVGCRSPYGVPRNPFGLRFVPGGSSAGSAVAVATGLVSFALGTDTAGSGRVPAAFNNIVGLKPTRGRISTRGVVPACRSLDCVSVFALSCEDAEEVLATCGAYDAEDPFARPTPAAAPFNAPFRFAVPRAADLEFFGEAETPALFEKAADALVALGGTRVETDFAPFRDASALLYDGPWVAERLAAIDTFFQARADALLAVTRRIIGGGATYSAVDAFKASYKLAKLRRRTEALWRHADVLLLPTTATIYTIAAVEAEPLALNARLGLYTNFVNLLDLSALVLPAGFRRDGLPFGISLIAPAFCDAALSALGARFQRHINLPLGATPHLLPPAVHGTAVTAGNNTNERVEIAVVGGHLSGMPLNHELVERGGHLVRAGRTAPIYRLFMLGSEPPRPGLVRDHAAGRDIETEVWSLSVAAFGAFVATVPSPLAIGTVVLEDEREVKGFLCESDAVRCAEDISAFGSWRVFVAQREG